MVRDMFLGGIWACLVIIMLQAIQISKDVELYVCATLDTCEKVAP